MMQTFDTQLQVTLRALREVVAPALEGSETHVIEQFNLALATLGFMQQRLPYARRFHRLELNHLVEFAGKVAALIKDDQPALYARHIECAREAEQALDGVEAEVEDYLIVGRKLRELIGLAVRESAAKPYEQALDRLVIAQQKSFYVAQRVWCVPLGLDTGMDNLPCIENILAKSTDG